MKIEQPNEGIFKGRIITQYQGSNIVYKTGNNAIKIEHVSFYFTHQVLSEENEISEKNCLIFQCNEPYPGNYETDILISLESKNLYRKFHAYENVFEEINKNQGLPLQFEFNQEVRQKNQYQYTWQEGNLYILGSFAFYVRTNDEDIRIEEFSYTAIFDKPHSIAKKYFPDNQNQYTGNLF